MRLEFNDIDDEDVFDYCVIGTGPAGISCAMTLAATGTKRVLLLEAGSNEFTRESQQIYSGTSTGDPYLNLATTRLRYFGGTSNHWNGWCRPLESLDFEQKGETNTAWPISKADLDVYLREASAILELPAIPDDLPLGDSGLNRIEFVWSPPIKYLEQYFPVRFLAKYFQVVGVHRNIFLLLNANVISFETNGSDVTGVHVANYSGQKLRVRAGYFVLATGGIENSRVLLWSNELTNGQLVKNAAALGRYWMDHPHFTLGVAFVHTRFLDDRERSQRRRIFLAPTADTIAKHNILNCGLRVDELGGGQYLDERRRTRTLEVIEDIGSVAPGVARRAMKLYEQGLVRGVRLRAAWEQEPVVSNGITLGNEKDALGVPRANLHWQKNELDRRTAQVCAQLFGEYMAREDLGRLRLDSWVTGEGDFPKTDEIGGPHHMGGTRMAETADNGVVDRNCKVFGQSNLYIAGSSVFTSGGHCNPTMTIVQLAVRLGYHLRNKT